MFNRKPYHQYSAFALERQRLLDAMAAVTPGSDEYTKILDQVTKLDKLHNDNTLKPVDSNTRATIAANIAGLLLIVNHERANIIATKAMTMLIKPR